MIIAGEAVGVLVALVESYYQYSKRCRSSNRGGIGAVDVVVVSVNISRKSLTDALLVNLNSL